MKKVTTGQLNGRPKKCVKTNGCKLFYPDDIELEDELYTNYAEVLMNGKVSSPSFLATTIQQSMQRIATDSKKDGELALRAVKELQTIASKTQKYFDGKKAIDSDFVEYNIRKGLFPWQKPIFDDDAKKITVLAGRRAGKSYAMSRKAVRHCLVQETKKRQVVIIGLTIEKTAAIYWEILKDCINKCHVPVRKIDNGQYTITFSNGNTIMLSGNNSKAEREKLRGFDISMAIIDECQSQQGLLYLCDQILGPQLKGRDGQILLVGTAPLSAGTYWEMAITDNEVSHYHATMEDNPTIPDFENALESVLEANHWDKDNIVYRREYLGEIAYDDNILIYPFVTYYDKIPETFVPRKAYVGMDLGWQDKSAIEAILIDDTGEAYLVSEWSESHATATYMLEKCLALRDTISNTYKVPMEDIHFITDTNEQQMTRDFYNKGLYELSNVRKKSLDYSRALVNEAMKSSQLHIPHDGPADTDHLRAVYKYDNDNNIIIYEEDKSTYHSNAMEAVRYAWQTYIEDISLCS